MQKWKLILFLFFVFSLLRLTYAQNINCDHIYWINQEKIYGYDSTAQKTFLFVNNLPAGASGLAISHHLAQSAGQSYFYTMVSGDIYYYDGKEWKNTGHTAPSVNLAAGDDYLYILDGNGKKLYTYDGISDAVFLCNLTDFVGPYDLEADDQGNFYLINTHTKMLVCYNALGKIIKQYPVEGLTDKDIGGGFAFRNNFIYANFTAGPMMGEYINGKLFFDRTNILLDICNDFASCPSAVFEPEKLPPSGDIILNKENIPLKIKGRDVEVQNTVALLSTDSLDIYIQDVGYPDGDSISITLNGRWILKNFLTSKSKYRLRIGLDKTITNNCMVVYALNLGKSPPNTTQVSFFVSGIEYKLAILSSLQTCGSINFINVPPK